MWFIRFLKVNSNRRDNLDVFIVSLMCTSVQFEHCLSNAGLSTSLLKGPSVMIIIMIQKP